MFSKFFEKNKSNGQLADYFKKKKRETGQPNLSCVNILKHMASNSNSPALSKQGRHERKTSPGQLIKQAAISSGRPSTSKQSIKKVKRIDRVELPSKEKVKDIERARPEPTSSRSPKINKTGFQDFFSSRGLKGISQTTSALKKVRDTKTRVIKDVSRLADDSLKARSTSKKLQKSQTSANLSTRVPKAFTPVANVSKRVSRESSQKHKKFADTVNSLTKKTTSDVGKLLDKEKKKQTANAQLLSAAKRNEAEKCLQLISGSGASGQGTDINCQDREGWTAVHHACWNENLKLVNILLYNDAKLDIADAGGIRPLSLAVSRGNASITRVLLKAGASVKFKDNGGNTALHYAAAKKNKNCMELLIEAGGRLDLKNAAGQTPLDVTSESFASLFELQRVAQSKVKESSTDKTSNFKGLMKKGQSDTVDNKSTHMESANTVTKSLFSSKTVVKS